MNKDDTFQIVLSNTYFPKGNIIDMGVKLTVVTEPKLSFWQRVRKFFGLNYTYTHTVKF